MKLYATITSERATKAQGGNKYLEIELLVGSRDNQQKAGIVLLEPTKYGFEVRYIPPAGMNKQDSVLLSEIKAKSIDRKITKGKKQKGKIYCNKCMKSTLGNNTLMKMCANCRE